MELNRLEDLKAAYLAREQEIKNDRSKIIEFLQNFIVGFRTYLDPSYIGLYPDTVTYELIQKHLKPEKDNLGYVFKFPLSLKERFKFLRLDVFIEAISKNNSQSTFTFLICGESFSLPPKDSDAPDEYIAVFNHIYEGFKEHINESCKL